MLVLITGTIVLFPTFIEILKTPFNMDWSIYTFGVLSVICLIIKGLVYYISIITSHCPDELSGIGNFLTFISVILFSVILQW